MRFLEEYPKERTEYLFLLPESQGEECPRFDMEAAVLEGIRYQKEMYEEAGYHVAFLPVGVIHFDDFRIISRYHRHRVQPVGPVEFVEMVYCAQGYDSRIHPINVPLILQSPEYSGRTIRRAGETAFLPETIKAVGGRAMVKSETRTKAKENGFINEEDSELLGSLPQDSWQISGILPEIRAEYRSFVFHGQVLYTAPYRFDPAVTCDPTFIQKCVRVWQGSDVPPAYTLDTAVLEDGRNVVMEVHNFISCGLYGFDRPDKILPMVIQANNWERRNQA